MLSNEASDVKLAVDADLLIGCGCGPLIPLNLISEFDLEIDAAAISNASGGNASTRSSTPS
jgi:hypothetical protein